ncbi:hypothetical protein [Methylobacterium haplocladii]|uniref:Uncharacterized protein n=1 Tax=Methylobacterium haplocladii TaxID=1176176 RepID=A0A512IUX8_9HYPH|nr:hypothetical protein [Methylobacterium haplocladii]GEP01507.1 hypothetical protein MHA02_38940 [Methylobacterium haplocladii]GJD82308.1 hypothetical protein HPGCJGGD_0160 [Methylobacterium haplocladii]GLS59158.1 hypothetical protein GCM10007887_18240 [Methylobacterium haplocladii]
MNPRRHPRAPGIDHSAMAVCWPSKIVTDMGADYRSDSLAATCAQLGIRFVSDECSGRWNAVSATASAVASPSGTCAGPEVGHRPKAEYPPD